MNGTTRATRPATVKQTNLIEQLDRTRDHELTAEQIDAAKHDIRIASMVIDQLFKAPRVQETRTPAVELEAAIYYMNGEVYKVQKAIHGSGNMYAKKLTVTYTCGGSCGTIVDESGAIIWCDGRCRTGEAIARFEYAPGVIRELTPADRMTREQAAQYGHIYGVCCKCGATLTDEDSIERGIGPVCRKAFA